MIDLIGRLGGVLLGGLFRVIDQAVEDKDQANAIKARLQEQVLTGQLEELRAATAILVAEAQGESWLQRNWRPLTMLVFVGLVVAKWLGFTAPGITEAIELKLFQIIELGLGGYVIGRSLEKVAERVAPMLQR